MKNADGRSVHLIGENGQAVMHIAYLVDIVIATACGALGERVKDSVAGLGRRLHDVQDVAHPNTAPFGDARPSLYAKMRGNLFLLRQRLQVGEGKLAWLLHQSADA